MDGTDPRARPHLYRAMAGLEAHKEAMEPALYGRRADRLSRAGALIVYATTSRHGAMALSTYLH
jgi:hypothetical protein